MTWKEIWGAVFYSVWLSCTTSHASLVNRGRVIVWAGGFYAQLAEMCLCVCVCTRICSFRKTQMPTWVLKTMHILISLIIHPYVTDERILVSVSGAGNVRGGGQAKGEGRSSKPKWLCSCRSLNLPLCTAQGEMRHSPGLAPVMWRGIREMNVFRISNNQRIISTPSAFKSMDPPRLKRHFD